VLKVSSNKCQNGVSLLEVMLVLAIAASIILMGMRLIGQFRYQASEQKLAATINQLFQGMNGFYYANCRQVLDQNSVAQSSGNLDPLVADASGFKSIYPLSISNLIPRIASANDWSPYNALVDNTVGEKGYFMQFNRVIESLNDPVMSVSACTGSDAPPSCNRTDGKVLSSSNVPSSQSHVATWVAQVAVKLSPTLTSTQWTQIKNDLGATCVSNKVGSSIATCDSSPTAAGYLVWTRTPAAFNPNISSEYWASMPYVTGFNRQYTNDGMANLSGVKNETLNSTTGKSWYNSLNYLCGG